MTGPENQPQLTAQEAEAKHKLSDASEKAEEILLDHFTGEGSPHKAEPIVAEGGETLVSIETDGPRIYEFTTSEDITTDVGQTDKGTMTRSWELGGIGVKFTRRNAAGEEEVNEDRSPEAANDVRTDMVAAFEYPAVRDSILNRPKKPKLLERLAKAAGHIIDDA